jgi:hypothetical protein
MYALERGRSTNIRYINYVHIEERSYAKGTYILNQIKVVEYKFVILLLDLR